MKKAQVLEDLDYIEKKLTRMMQVVRQEKERILNWSENNTASPTFTNPLRASVLKVREAAEVVEDLD